MSYDSLAHLSENLNKLEELEDYHTRFKYLLTRDPTDARRDYQECLRQFPFPVMAIYAPSMPPMDYLPDRSFFLQIHFKLASPFISRDDDAFYICDNPIRKDKVFKSPVVPASTWKGNLRWTARKIRGIEPHGKDGPIIIRLFGNERAEDKEFNQGRLFFYPSFFSQIGLEVINPHDRKTKAGTMPIYIECIPAGAEGSFSLLYVPFDNMAMPEAIRKGESEEDLDLILKSLREMMLTYGFSAKKGTGYGIIREEFKEGSRKGGFIQIKKVMPDGARFSNFAELEGLTIKSDFQEER